MKNITIPHVGFIKEFRGGEHYTLLLIKELGQKSYIQKRNMWEQIHKDVLKLYELNMELQNE